MTDTILERCTKKGLRLTGPRRVIAQVLEASHDHPDVEELHARVARLAAPTPANADPRSAVRRLSLLRSQ
jgi:Fe2+ or Zn2+ uptake regulation protein